MRPLLAIDFLHIDTVGLLAEREYLYGRELLRLGREAEALTAIEACFDLNPDHTQARDLLMKLRRTARRQRKGAGA